MMRALIQGFKQKIADEQKRQEEIQAKQTQEIRVLTAKVQKKKMKTVEAKRIIAQKEQEQ